MKLLLLLAMISSVAFAAEKQLYQVMSQHPHDVEKVRPYIQTESESGRLWIVTLKKQAPASAMEYLRPITMNDVAHYTPASNKVKATAKKEIVKILKEVSSANIKASVVKLASYKTRYAGTLDNQNAIAQLTEELAAMGYPTTTECYKPTACSVDCNKSWNI